MEAKYINILRTSTKRNVKQTMLLVLKPYNKALHKCSYELLTDPNIDEKLLHAYKPRRKAHFSIDDHTYCERTANIICVEAMAEIYLNEHYKGIKNDEELADLLYSCVFSSTLFFIVTGKFYRHGAFAMWPAYTFSYKIFIIVIILILMFFLLFLNKQIGDYIILHHFSDIQQI